ARDGCSGTIAPRGHCKGTLLRPRSGRRDARRGLDRSGVPLLARTNARRRANNKRMETFGLRNRRAILGFAVLLLAGMTATPDGRAQQSPPLSSGILESVRPDSRLVIFYLGAPDCPYCQHWEAKSREDLV